MSVVGQSTAVEGAVALRDWPRSIDGVPFPSPAELSELVAGTGWRLAEVVEGEPPDYYALLEKARRRSDSRAQATTE